ncbi:mediator of RNA polymerase II transcription subunit 13 [Trapelia coarctata]|nr:mediator of RNA polymerase II transcription subunit 13 [Trapelia coarctata]
MAQKSTVVLAPFGIVASRFLTDADELLNQAFERDENGNIIPSEWSATSGSSTSKITSLLRRCGIQISENCSWVSIGIPMSHAGSTGGDLDKASAHIMQWPAQLCFHDGESDEIDGRRSAFIWQGLLDNDTDPLRDAEIWFRDRHDRKEKIECRRLELKMLSEKEAQTSLIKEEDIRSGLFPGIERQNETQGLSGIYPTPPDGFRSHAGHSTELEGSDPVNRQEDVEMQDPGDDNNKTTNQGGTPLNPLHGVGMSLGAYDGIEDDDLFGNMDSAMFTAHGITEDDFSFFDEPKAPPSTVSTSLAVPADAQNLSAADPTLDNGFESLPKHEEDDKMLIDDGHGQSEDDYHPHNQDQDAQQRIDAPVDHETLHSNSSRQVSFRLPDATSSATGQDHGSGDLVGNTPLGLDATSEENPLDRRRSAFAALSLKNLPQIVDQKYAGQGRFFAEQGQIDGSFHSEAYKVEKSVPTLGFGIGQDDDFDSDTEDTYTSNTSSPPDKADEYVVTSVNASKPNSSGLLPQSDDQLIIQYAQTSTEVSRADPFRSPNDQTVDTKTVSPLMLQISDSPLVCMASNGELLWGAAGLRNGLYTGHNEDFIQVAQIVADQLTALDPTFETSSLEPATRSKKPQYEDPLGSIVPALFPQSESCTLESCASTGETHRGVIAPPKVVIRPLQRRVDSIRGSADHAPSSASIFNLDTPNVRVLRGDSLMELSATGLHFWEELGLNPCLGPKSITGYCVYPHTEMIHRGVASFMDLMSMTYQSLRLGTHLWGHETMSEFSEGFVSVALSNDGMVISPSSIDAVCERLGTYLFWNRKTLSSNHATGETLGDPTVAGQTIVIYLVNPFTKPAFLPRLCESFLRCLRKFETGLDPADQSDLVLKVLPISWVASRTTIPLPTPKEYAALAKDVYDRCPVIPSSRNPSPFASTSLVQLAKAIPKSLDFRLAASPISSLTRNNSALHVGYSWPKDSQWLCVSVVDSLGSLQWNASYCFGTAISDPWPTFTEIAKEIWRGILDMIDEPQAKRHIYLIKDELLAQEEIDAWRSLCPSPDQSQPVTSTPSHPLLTLLLLAAEIQPPIYASPRPHIIPPSDDPTLSATAASTPLATAPTPTADLASPGFPSSNLKPLDASSFDTDPSARLIDVRDESWGLVAPRCFSTAIFNIPAALSVGSGYLIKRRGVRDEEGWCLMGVHVLSAEKWGEASMRELLGTYRALAAVARWRGVGEGGVPLHLAWVERAGRGVRRCMAYLPPAG